jgi:hypothetical protein
MNEHLDILWKTYDFALGKVTFLEDEYDFLIKELGRYYAQKLNEEMNESGILSRGILNAALGDELNASELKSAFVETTKDLKNYYDKQLVIIKELEDYYLENPYEIPEDREMSVGCFRELLEVTVLLKNAVLKSTEDAKKNLTS